MFLNAVSLISSVVFLQSYSVPRVKNINVKKKKVIINHSFIYNSEVYFVIWFVAGFIADNQFLFF